MSPVKKDNAREDLERELHHLGYRRLLEDLQTEGAVLCRFETWSEVVAFVRQSSAKDPDVDQILRPLLRAYQQGGDQRAATVLLVVFWPGLKGIAVRKRRWDPEPEELWQVICLQFVLALRRLDLARRNHGLVRRVLYDTLHHTYEEYVKIWDRRDPEILMDMEGLTRVMGGSIGIEMVEAELRIDQTFQVRALGRAARHAGLKAVDFELIAGTRIYGAPLRECAQEAGLSYEAAKKRRRRAERRMARHWPEKK